MLLAYSVVVDGEFLLELCEHFGQPQVWYIIMYHRTSSLELHVRKFLHISVFLPQLPVYPATSPGVCNARNVLEFSCVRSIYCG